jgi:hypothetical protein
MMTMLHRAALAAFLVSIPALSLNAAPDSKPTIDAVAAAARIDELVLDCLKKEKLEPNADAGDEVFVRRVHLDLIGRTPTKSETLAFLESQDPDKRAKLVDSLIGSDGYVSHQYNWFADILRSRTSISGNNQSVGAGMAYEKWIKDAIRANRPYNEIVYDLVTASGSSWQNPAIGYYLRDFGMPLDNLAITTQVFLGTQIVCAQCHNHPFDSVTQMDYYHLAAFTYGMNGTNGHPVQQAAMKVLEQQRAKVAEAGADEEGNGKGKGKGKNKPKAKMAKSENPYAGPDGDLRKAASEILFPVRFNNILSTDRALRLPKDYQYDDANPLAVVKPLTLFGKEAVLSESSHPIEAFGEWLTSPENPRFTKVIANRLWKRAFGLGLIEPVDDLKESSVAPNAPLMDYLEQLMRDLDYDLQTYQRILFRTKAYQREAALEEPVPGAPYYFAGPILRRMSAEQIWDSLVAMTVDDPDRPDKARILAGDKRLAEVQLIAEAIYDQAPAQFLKNMREVVKIQAELSLRIEAAEKKVAEAREKGDPDLIKQAGLEAREIKNELDQRIEEVVYRDGLQRKLDELKGQPAVEPASKVTGGAPTGESSDLIAGERLMDEFARSLLANYGTFEEGMAEVVGSERSGIIKELIEPMFAEREAALRVERETARTAELAAWKVKAKEDKTAYRNFDRIIRDRMKRASELNQPAAAGHFLREFGQSDRELIENASHDASVTQALAMLNGPTLSSVTNKYSVLMRDMKGEKFEDRLDTIYLTMLSRLPTDEEKAIFRKAWAADPESGTVTGMVWTVLNTRQFLFIQ